MSRVPPLDPAELPEDVRAVVDLGTEALGFTPNDGLVMARRPGLLAALSQLVGEVWGPGRLDDGLKRLVAELSSKTAGCMYCTAHAAHAAARAGVTAEKLDQLWTFERSDLYDDAERAALVFTVAASQSPAATTDADFARLREHFDDEQIVELMGVIACFGFLNRWNDNMATALEQTPLAFAHQSLDASQWDAGKHGDAER